MPIRSGDRPGLGGAAKLVADRARSLVRLELQLAAAELKQKVATIGIGIGLVVGAVLLGFFALAFALAAIAAAIATMTSVWVALLIVTGALVLLAVLLAAVGVASIRRGTPPVPEQALAEARLTVEAVKNGTH
jgi:membrane protein implicated in regulation of membrane protease activity